MKRQTKKGLLYIVTGVLLLLAAFVVWLFQVRQDENAGEEAACLLEEMAHTADTVSTELPQSSALDPEEVLVEGHHEMETIMVNGHEAVGTVSIPALGLELPVMSDWSYDLLKLSPCRYCGTAAGRDLILMGHNYRSHFRNLKNLTGGEEVLFTGVNGLVYAYFVEEVEILHRREVDQLASDHELILFTCVQGGLERVVVRCRAAESQGEEPAVK